MTKREKGENELQGKFPSNQRKGVIRVKSRGENGIGNGVKRKKGVTKDAKRRGVSKGGEKKLKTSFSQTGASGEVREQWMTSFSKLSAVQNFFSSHGRLEPSRVCLKGRYHSSQDYNDGTCSRSGTKAAELRGFCATDETSNSDQELRYQKMSNRSHRVLVTVAKCGS